MRSCATTRRSCSPVASAIHYRFGAGLVLTAFGWMTGVTTLPSCAGMIEREVLFDRAPEREGPTARARSGFRPSVPAPPSTVPIVMVSFAANSVRMERLV